MYDNSRIIMVFILITLAMQLLSQFTRRLNEHKELLEQKSLELQESNRKMEEANAVVRRAMEQIMSLYQVVEAFASQDNQARLLKNFVDYTAELTRTPTAFFYMCPYKGGESSIVISSKQSKNTGDLERAIKTQCQIYRNPKTPLSWEYDGCHFYITTVKSLSYWYGFLGIQLEGEGLSDDRARLIEFLTSLMAVVLERFRLEQMTHHLMIIEEQNRIANEIHDSVSQRLFSIVCAIHAITAKTGKIADSNLWRQLILIKESANSAMKELRSSIYGLSPKKRGENAFFFHVRTYLEGLSQMNRVEIKTNIKGEENRLNYETKKALYRIISEATGNSIRHGCASKLEVNLEVKQDFNELIIKDNGAGFSVENLKQKKERGLGISNMKSLVRKLHGSFKIDSNLGVGTTVKVVIPNEAVLTDKIELTSRGVNSG